MRARRRRTRSAKTFEKHLQPAIEFINDRNSERHWGFDNCLIPFLFTKELRENRAMQICARSARPVAVPFIQDHSRHRTAPTFPEAGALRPDVPLQRRRLGAAGHRPCVHQPLVPRRLSRFLSQHLRPERSRMKRTIIHVPRKAGADAPLWSPHSVCARLPMPAQAAMHNHPDRCAQNAKTVGSGRAKFN
jgi:hypothetical protein